MVQDSNIQWTHHTQNFWRGCRKVHTGCTNCYAESHFSCALHGVRWGTQKQGGVRKVPAATTWNSPFAWNNHSTDADHRSRVFCMSLGDLFESWSGPVVDYRNKRLFVNDFWEGSIRQCRAAAYATEQAVLKEFRSQRRASANGFRAATLDDVRRDAFEVIQHCDSLDWLLLTKHGLWKDADKIIQCWPHECHKCGFQQWWSEAGRCNRDGCNGKIKTSYIEHAWLLGSVSDQVTADIIVKQLHRIKRMGICKYVGLSAEPLTGPIRLKKSWKWLDWVIVGGESTQRGQCRAMDLAWAKALVDDCRRLRVACYVKQLGSNAGTTAKSGIWRPRETEDKKGGTPSEWPRYLQVRKYPTGEREI